MTEIKTIKARIKFLKTMQKEFMVTGSNPDTGLPTTPISVNEIKNYEKVFHRRQLDNELILELDGATKEINHKIWFKEINPTLRKNNFNFELSFN